MSLETTYKQLIEAHVKYDYLLVEKLLMQLDTQEVVADPLMIKEIDSIRAWSEAIRLEEALSQKYGRLIKELMQALDTEQLKEASEIRNALEKLKQIPLPKLLEVRYNQLMASGAHKRACKKMIALVGSGILVLLTLLLSIYFVHQYKTEKKEKHALEWLKKQIDQKSFELAQKNIQFLIEERPVFLKNKTFLRYQNEVTQTLSKELKQQKTLISQLNKIRSHLLHPKDASWHEKEKLVKIYYHQMIVIKNKINLLLIDTQMLMITFKKCEIIFSEVHVNCDREAIDRLKNGILELNESISSIYSYDLENEKSLEKANEKYKLYTHYLADLQSNRFAKSQNFELELTHLQMVLNRLGNDLIQAQQYIDLKHLPEIKNYPDYKNFINEKGLLPKKLKIYDDIFYLGNVGRSIKKLKETDLLKWSNDNGFPAKWQVSFQRAKALCHLDEMTHKNILENIKALRNIWGDSVLEILLTDSLNNKTHLYTQKMPKFLKNVQGEIVLCWIDVFTPNKEIQKMTLYYDSTPKEWILNSKKEQKRFVKTNLSNLEKGDALASFITYSDSFLVEYTQIEPDKRLTFLSAQWGKLEKLEDFDHVLRYEIAYKIIQLASSVYHYDSEVFSQLLKNFNPDSKLQSVPFKAICAQQQTFRNGAIYVELLHIVPSGFLTKNEQGILTLHPFNVKDVREYWSIERNEHDEYLIEKVADRIEPIQFLPSAHPHTYNYQLLWSPLGYDTDSVRSLSYPQRPALWPRNITWP